MTNFLLPEDEKDLALALTAESRGFESAGSKRAMRAAVLASDALVWLPCTLAALLVFSSSGKKRRGKEEEGEGEEKARRRSRQQQQRLLLFFWPAAAVLLQPALVLVDHGHLQFNGIGLGLSAAAAAAAATDKRILSSILFTAALNHKQMAMYFAPAFLGHLLGRCLESAKRAGRSKGGSRKERNAPSSSSLLLLLLRTGLRAAALGLTVALTMLFLWWPVVPKKDGALSGAITVLSRLAPVQRGIFEDYVANFWCASHPLFKWKRRFSREQLARAAAALTLAASFPAALHQVLRPSKRGMLYCMACSSFAFFLFSYQVHEKSILLPLLPVSLLALGSEGGETEEKKGKKEDKAGFFFSSLASAPPSEPFLACWLPVAGCFSMWPLLHRDGLAWSYAGCLVLWIGAVVTSRPEAEGEEEEEERRRRRQRTRTELVLLYGPVAAVAGALLLHACHALVEPPQALPWLWDAAITSYCSIAFFAAFCYLNLRMWLCGGLQEKEETLEQKATSTARALPRRAGPAAASSSRAKRD